MLETHGMEYGELLQKTRTVVSEVNVKTLSPGTVVYVRTESGNEYLLEVVDPSRGTAHVVRRAARGAARAGYLGVRTILDRLVIHQKLWHQSPRGISNTSPINALALIAQ
ncbi:MAG: hypothetical protein KGI50_04845 [Patescibacteria group bacterium]|nr:hypothetical protein [Patescibacteria group bacterium]MDE2438635.1 hypothetical protein [Patescibacteria group bacterium]